MKRVTKCYFFIVCTTDDETKLSLEQLHKAMF